uniref:F-box domain-containing protein n=1 Tax=Parastrongyloides trichosuri TaxID=131310 RepID=A0A0N4ZRY4_PARTI
MILNYLPIELNYLILSQLSYEDIINLQEACQSTASIIFHYLSKIYRLQIADDPSDCILENVEGKKIPYKIENLKSVMNSCLKINSVVIATRGVDKFTSNNELFSTIFENGLYNECGYLGTFFSIAPQHYLTSNQLKTVALHVDLMMDKIFETRIIYPTADLQFATNMLADKNFDVFIQIGFCATTKHPYDFLPRSFIGMDMHNTFAYFKKRGYRGSIDVSPQTEYMDLTLEKNNIEYSFALFYYDENLCFIGDEDMDEGMNDNNYDDISIEEEYFGNVNQNNSSEIDSLNNVYMSDEEIIQISSIQSNNINNTFLLQKISSISDDNLLIPLEYFQNPLLTTGQETKE